MKIIKEEEREKKGRRERKVGGGGGEEKREKTIDNCKEKMKKTLAEMITLTLLAPTPQSGQTHSNNSLPICQQIV